MRSDDLPDDRLAEITRRRLQLLSAEIAGARVDMTPRLDESPEPPVDRRPPDRPGRHALRRPVRSAQVAGWLQDRLPATLQGRVRLGAVQVAVLAVVAALGLALSAWWVLASDDAGTLAPTAAGVAALHAAPLVETSTPSPAGVIVVDVAGRVRRPGIATLPAGSRVVDALRAAGGVRPGVALVAINRARVLVDGEQIVVGMQPPSGVAQSVGASPAGSSLVNLNTADSTALEALPGVGPVTAGAILAWRTENGGFRSIDQLLDVTGIGDATLAEIAPHVTL